jgi:hypothetical protein
MPKAGQERPHAAAAQTIATIFTRVEISTRRWQFRCCTHCVTLRWRVVVHRSGVEAVVTLSGLARRKRRGQETDMSIVRRFFLGMTLAAALVVAAWQASAGQGVLLGTTALAEGAVTPQGSDVAAGATGGESESPWSQSGSLILFGLALAFAGRSLKSLKAPS